MLNKKHNLKSGNSKDTKKGFERKNKTGNHKKEKILIKITIAIEYVDVVPFMKQKQRRKKMKERDKNKNQKKAKKKDKKEEKEQEQERQTEEREIEKGGAKKG